MDNLELYNKFREVPENAKKTIGGGRLKGMTDINPMWRIKKLTEQFGPCGIGWYFRFIDKWTEEVENITKCGKEVIANVQIELFYKNGDDWSAPVPGIGGAMLATFDRSGHFIDDEAFKKATTDAISVACKELGIGADVYWDKDRTKYTNGDRDNAPADNAIFEEEERLRNTAISTSHVKNIEQSVARLAIDGLPAAILNEYNVNSLSDLTEAQYGDCMRKLAYEENRKQERVIGAE